MSMSVVRYVAQPRWNDASMTTPWPFITDLPPTIAARRSIEKLRRMMVLSPTIVPRRLSSSRPPPTMHAAGQVTMCTHLSKLPYPQDLTNQIKLTEIALGDKEGSNPENSINQAPAHKNSRTVHVYFQVLENAVDRYLRFIYAPQYCLNNRVLAAQSRH